jgi:hypothetical protein
MSNANAIVGPQKTSNVQTSELETAHRVAVTVDGQRIEWKARQHITRGRKCYPDAETQIINGFIDTVVEALPSVSGGGISVISTQTWGQSPAAYLSIGLTMTVITSQEIADGRPSRSSFAIDVSRLRLSTRAA